MAAGTQPGFEERPEGRRGAGTAVGFAAFPPLPGARAEGFVSGLSTTAAGNTAEGLRVAWIFLFFFCYDAVQLFSENVSEKTANRPTNAEWQRAATPTRPPWPSPSSAAPQFEQESSNSPLGPLAENGETHKNASCSGRDLRPDAGLTLPMPSHGTSPSAFSSPAPLS